MDTFSPPLPRGPILASDLDGTFLPLPGHPENHRDLATLADQLPQRDVTLIYITGRHFSFAQQAISEAGLPSPDWLICDVGTSIFQRHEPEDYRPVVPYQQHQEKIIAGLPIATLREQLQAITGLRLQEEEKQGPFKLSYYTDANKLENLSFAIRQHLKSVQAPYSPIASVDPFNGEGLLDLLPAHISKAHALAWWVEHTGLNQESLVFAGDSGNDLAALTAGYRAIIVGNADRALAQQAYQVHQQQGWTNRLYLARATATSGVLEGCRWFEVVDSDPPPIQQLGATPITHQRTHFRVWAPRHEKIAVMLDQAGGPQLYPLTRQEAGYFTGEVANVPPGTTYRYQLDEAETYPDPATHFQPEGVQGPSQVIDHEAFPWTDQAWDGVTKRDLVIYELHIGSFTKEGTFRGAIERLPELVDLGITAVEVMPVAQSPGRWNWGYDGVDLFAVRNTFGTPDDFKALVDACHAHGLAVLLDVVYNHVGPEGNYLARFGPYFSRRHHTPWGDAFNYDGRHAQPVRQFIIENALFWLDKYHLDGLRLDAVHFIHDESDLTMLQEMRQAISRYAATVRRPLHLIAEANVYDHQLLTQHRDHEPYDAIWCDCLMYALYSHALPDLHLTSRRYHGAGDVAEVLDHGYLFLKPQPERTSEPTRSDRSLRHENRQYLESLVTALQTHDGVGNHPRGLRIHQLTSPSFQRAAAGLVLLYPSIPLLFMGEEYAANTPFPFFVDFEDQRLRRTVDRGRARDYPKDIWGDVLRPSDPATFECAKCCDANDFSPDMFAWYQQLIALRKKGIAEGWLAAERLHTGHDPEQNLFWLRYEDHRGGAVTVLARLTPVAKHGAEFVTTAPANATLLLASEPKSTTPKTAVSEDKQLLAPNDLVVWQS